VQSQVSCALLAVIRQHAVEQTLQALWFNGVLVAERLQGFVYFEGF
jgi:hypothetical protein